jgi:ABC-type phosphate/phosphonate transport system permease subunit
VHELLWALLILAALGLTPLSAVLAIGIPQGAYLGKVFAELLDRAPTESAAALRDAGASNWRVFFFGLLPRALPDLGGYALYRFECALRASVVLGFFGWQTLGYHLRLEWNVANHAAVWTWLWSLVLLVVVVEVWSRSLRRRFIA